MTKARVTGSPDKGHRAVKITHCQIVTNSELVSPAASFMGWKLEPACEKIQVSLIPTVQMKVNKNNLQSESEINILWIWKRYIFFFFTNILYINHIF